jgi:hypothetical protein
MVQITEKGVEIGFVFAANRYKNSHFLRFFKRFVIKNELF